MVLSIEAKRIGESRWEVYTENGREKTGIDVVEWAERGVEFGAGEILLTSVDQEGTEKGFDYELVRSVASRVPVPVIASGGMGTIEHLIRVVREGQADAVAIADVLHFGRLTLATIRAGALNAGIHVRRV